MNSIEQSQLEN